jgi:hypothetical protein
MRPAFSSADIEAPNRTSTEAAPRTALVLSPGSRSLAPQRVKIGSIRAPVFISWEARKPHNH